MVGTANGWPKPHSSGCACSKGPALHRPPGDGWVTGNCRAREELDWSEWDSSHGEVWIGRFPAQPDCSTFPSSIAFFLWDHCSAYSCSWTRGKTMPPLSTCIAGGLALLRVIPRTALSSFPRLFLAFISPESLLGCKPSGRASIEHVPASRAEPSAGPLRVYQHSSAALAKHHQPLCQPLEVTEGTPRRGRLPTEGARSKPPIDFSGNKRRLRVKNQIKALPSTDPPKATGIGWAVKSLFVCNPLISSHWGSADITPVVK